MENQYDFEQYCSFVEQELIDKAIPALLKQGALDNKSACFHTNQTHASFVVIPSQLRKHAETQNERTDRVKDICGLLSPSNKEYLERHSSGQALLEAKPNSDVKEISRLFENYSKREYKRWEYIAVEHNGETEDLYSALLLFHPDTFQITTKDLDGLDKRGF